MTTQALNSAVSGLRIAQRSLDVTASNISNANTEGYTKKTLTQSTIIADGVGVGVRAGEIIRNVDEAVQRDFRTQVSVQAFQTTRESYLSRIIALSGSTDSETNIAAGLSDIYNKFVSLSSTPDSTAAQTAVVTSAKSFATKLNNYSAQLTKFRNDTQQGLKNEVISLNTALQGIAKLNISITGNISLNRSTADLEDQRDLLVKQVSEQMDISYYKDGNGALVLQTKNGHLLVDTTAREVSFDDSTLTPTALYPNNGVSGVILHDTAQGSYDLASSSPGGKIGALLQLRDQEIPSYNAQIDELAHKTMMRFNDQGLALFTNSNGLIPINDPAAYAGLAGSIKVNDAVANDSSLVQQGTTGTAIAVGSTSIIDKVINYTFGKFKDASGTPNVAFKDSGTGANREISFNITSDLSGTLGNFANSFISSQAADYDSVKQSKDTETSYMQELQTRLLDNSAVNTDEEMTKMIQYQRGYGASAKMITALDQLFQELLNAI